MVGLIQIMIYMLAVYLVYKGVEIFQIALMSTREDRSFGFILGLVCVMGAIVAAIGFSLWATQVAASIGERINSLPQLGR